MKILLIATIIAATTTTASATLDHTDDKNAIRSNAHDYVNAFKRKDAETLANYWVSDAVYISSATGNRTEGREAIKKNFKDMFTELGNPELQLTIESIEFQDDDHAIEQGTARVVIPGRLPMDSYYTTIQVKRDGEWKIQSITESEIRPGDIQLGHLQELAWLIGNWVDKSDQIKVETQYQWTLHKHFIQCKFTVYYENHKQLNGKQIIGWDPENEEIRSWIFDSDGGRGEGVWSKEGNVWNVHVTSILPNGGKGSSIHTYKLINAGSFKYSIRGRAIDGYILPNTNEVTVIRTKI